MQQMKKTGIINSENAEIMALSALEFMGADAERWSRFSSLTGVTAENLRERAKEKDFLAGILDVLLHDESLLLVFCTHAGIDPEAPMQARRALEE